MTSYELVVLEYWLHRFIDTLTAVKTVNFHDPYFFYMHLI